MTELIVRESLQEGLEPYELVWKDHKTLFEIHVERSNESLLISQSQLAQEGGEYLHQK